jgi:thiosulfate reductase cytochrome b subunit
VDHRDGWEVLKMKVEALERETTETRQLLRESRESVVSLKERVAAMEKLLNSSQRLILLLILNLIAILVQIGLAVAGWLGGR